MKRKWKHFSSLTPKERVFRCINLVLMIGFFLASLTIMLLGLLKWNDKRVFLSSIVMMVLFILPLVIELIFGRRLSNIVTLCYVCYVILAGFIGSLLSVYYLFEGFDKIVHVIFGYIFSIPAIFLISLCQDYTKLKPLTIAFFCLFFSLALELLWEILEFGIDRILNQTMQGIPVEGYGVPLVTDTITDLICNTCGALIFFVHFLVGKMSKHNLGISQIEKELVFTRNNNPHDVAEGSGKQAHSNSKDELEKEEQENLKDYLDNKKD